MLEGEGMSSTTFILFGFAYIPRLLAIKPKNFSAETPKAHLAGFNFMLYSFRIRNASARWAMWSLAVVDFTNMSSIYTSMDASVCF